MTVPVPVGLSATSSWQVADWLDRAYNSTPAAGGTALLTLPALPDNERWQLTHMVTGCTSTTPTALRLYLDSVAAPGYRDGTDRGNFDVADWPQGLWVPPGRQLLAQWSGCSDAAVGTLTLQAVIYRRTT
jgi:hypothetical protein